MFRDAEEGGCAREMPRVWLRVHDSGFRRMNLRDQTFLKSLLVAGGRLIGNRPAVSHDENF